MHLARSVVTCIELSSRVLVPMLVLRQPWTSVQNGFHCSDDIDEPRPKFLIQTAVVDPIGRSATIEGEHPGAVRSDQGSADGIDIRLPFTRRNREAPARDIVNGAQYAIQDPGPLCAEAGREALQNRSPLGLAQGSQIGASHGGRRHGDARSHIETHRHGRGTPTLRQIDHAEPIPAPYSHGSAGLVRERLHVGPGDLANAEIGERRIAKSKCPGRELILPEAPHMSEIAELRQRVGEARDRGFGQARALGEFLIAEKPVLRLERPQYLEPARKRDDELTVAGSTRLGLCAGRMLQAHHLSYVHPSGSPLTETIMPRRGLASGNASKRVDKEGSTF